MNKYNENFGNMIEPDNATATSKIIIALHTAEVSLLEHVYT